MLIRSLALSLTLVSIAGASCSSGGIDPGGPGSMAPSSPGSPASPGDMNGMDHGESFTFGAPAEAVEADRMIDVEALDTLRFDPASIDIELGETVTFNVTNDGLIGHEFVLGNAAAQDQHQGQMGDMDGSMSPEANVAAVDPSEQESLTWTFTEPGTVLYACHVDDHFVQGMVGEIRVK